MGAVYGQMYIERGCDIFPAVKGNTIFAFILGIALGAGATYFMMRAEVQRAMAEAAERVGKTVRTVGTKVEKAGRDMKTPEDNKTRK